MFCNLNILSYFCLVEIINCIHGKVSKILLPLTCVWYGWLAIEPSTPHTDSGEGYFFSVQTRIIKIPKSLSSAIAAESATLKPMTVYYQLKALYTGGTINRIRSRYSEVATVLGISESKLRKSLKWLYNKEFARIGTGGELRLVSNKVIKEYYGCEVKKKLDYIKFNNSKEVELNIKALSMDNCFKAQEYIRGEKILSKYVHNRNFTGDVKQAVIKYYLREEEQRVKSIEEILKPSINLQITLSRKGVAKRFGCVSHSTGSRLVKKLKERGYVTDTKNQVKLVNGTYNDCLNYRIENQMPNLFYKDGAVWMTRCNQISVAASKVVCN